MHIWIANTNIIGYARLIDIWILRFIQTLYCKLIKPALNIFDWLRIYLIWNLVGEWLDPIDTGQGQISTQLVCLGNHEDHEDSVGVGVEFAPSELSPLKNQTKLVSNTSIIESSLNFSEIVKSRSCHINFNIVGNKKESIFSKKKAQKIFLS